MKKIKMILVSIVAVVLAITASVMLVGCKKEQSLSFAKAYDYSAVAGIGILKTEIDNGVSLQSAQVNQLDQAQKDQIINSIAVSQNLTSEYFVKTEVVVSDRAEYEYQYTVKTRDYTGGQEVYTFYYTQTDISDEEDIRENEKEYRLNGLVILDGIEYQMVGEQEVEQGEMEYTFKILIDNNNYVIIEQETELNETEFEYTVYKGGKKVFSTEIEYEVDRKGNVEFEYELVDRQNNVSQKYKFVFFEKGGEKFAKVVVKDNKSTVLAIVKISQTQNGFQYDFING